MLGAGSIGVGTALHLQQRGWQVTLIDRREPARETSFGNAGVINSSSFVPLNSPAMHASLLSLLKNDKAQLRYNLGYLLGQLPWILQFLRDSKSRKAMETSQALHALITPALDEHKALMQRVGNMHRLSELGWLKLFRHGHHFDRDGFEAAMYDRYQVPVRHLDAAGIRDLEPALKAVYGSGFLLEASASVNNPGALVTEYAERFVADGGTLIREDIETIETRDNGNGFTLRTTGSPLHCERLVIAAGPWSGDLLTPLGYSVPMGYERGYHVHLRPAAGSALQRPIHDVTAGFVLAPMEYGIRLTTGVEMNARDAPDQLAQLEQVMPRIHEAIDIETRTEHPLWRGSRPTLPDSRPVIGRAPAHHDLWFAFGHHHIGLMSGPITGKLIAQLVSNEPTDIDLAPFAPERVISRHRSRRKH